ncbi:hypothetical protein RR48_06191 [Papilio machaon]|uniref:Uncharacterized protein n=1 Tax=Papilio machaon TaxID=76193 RepID=A0A194QT53_PAPMA|nr:hypothetical protein RR48_06191 [Papilio machaon]
MDCCFVNECERFAVTPVLVSPQVKCCESAPIYVPCCNDKVVYCCEKIRPCTPVARKICYDGNCDHTCTLCSEPPQKICPTCRQPTGPPAKPAVKYVMPCYRYEDGRIEQFDSKVHGKLPATAYKRNGIQDQINGYRGARRDLCAVEHDGKYFVKVMPSTALKRNGIQDHEYNESGGVSYLCQSPNTAIWSDRPFYMPIKAFKRIANTVQNLPVSAFKRNGMQDQEHSKLLGTANFLYRCRNDIAIDCDA